MTSDDPLDHDAPSGGVGTISGDVGSVVTAPHGPTHTGPGPQINAVVTSAEWRDLLTRPLRPGYELRLVSVGRRSQLRSSFTPPPGFHAALATLTTHRLVLVHGARGDGAPTAAVMLLDSSGQHEDRFRELPDDSDGDPTLDPELLHHGDRLLLDVSDLDVDLFRALQRKLEHYRSHVEKNEAYLAVVVSPDQQRLLADEFKNLLRPIHRPDALTVLCQHLAAKGLHADETRLHASGLRATLATASMGQIADLAHRVRTKHDDNDGQGELTTWITTSLHDQNAEQSLPERTTHIQKNGDGRQRALLLAAAVLTGRSADAALYAATQLTDITRHPQEETPLLDRPCLTHQLSALGVTVTDQRLIGFAHPHHGAAVRDFFWDNLPELRPHLKDWVKECVRDDRLTPRDHHQIVEWFTSQCLRDGRVDWLNFLVSEWTNSNQNGRLSHHAATILRGALKDFRHGWRMRRRIYDWARVRDTPPDLAQVLIAVCAEVLASTHLDQATVRLHHLTRNRNPRVATAAREALVELAGDDRVRRLLLDRVQQRLIENRHHAADLALFWSLAGPSHAIPHHANTDVRGSLMHGWSAIMARHPSETWTPHVHRWLQECTDQPNHEPALRLLVTAAAQAGTLNRLYAAIRSWIRDTTDTEASRSRHAVARHALQQVNRAQGLDI